MKSLGWKVQKAENLEDEMLIGIQTMSEQISAIVRERILRGKMELGKVIRQESLAEELNVSVVPLRQALARLHHEGVLCYLAHRGYFVRSFTEAQLFELYTLRLKLEPDSIALASTVATFEERSSAKRALQQLNSAYERDPEGFEYARSGFSISLLQPFNQEIIFDILIRLIRLSAQAWIQHMQGDWAHSVNLQTAVSIYHAWTAARSSEVAAKVREDIERNCRTCFPPSNST
ncbi:MAG: GntR family transcriptional regulator [Asticcacaulis sp.]|uniref:GntR family transcriptional regulator n=1 Tax=Asticcacaulis sp. TaxID=1872648 RepID=UPI0039E41BE2